MDVFPETLVPEIPLKIKYIYRTLVTELDNGTEFRRRKWLFPRREITLTYRYLTKEEQKILLDFLVEKYGSYEPFYLFDWLVRRWVKEFVGYTDGNTTTFILPGKEIDENSVTIYRDGSV